MLNLLVVDDEQIMRRAVSVIVQKYIPEIQNVFEADSGRKAIEIAGKERIHIVCMDIKMPGIDGIEAIRQIQKCLPEASFLIISAFDEFKMAAAAMQMGVKQYLLKPLDRDEFIRVIYQIIEEQRRRQENNEKELYLKESLSLLEENLSRQMLYAFMTGSADALEGPYDRRMKENFAGGGAAFVLRFYPLSRESGENAFKQGNPDRISKETADWKLYLEKAEKKVQEYAAQVSGISGKIQDDRLTVFLPGRDETTQTGRRNWLKETAELLKERIQTGDHMGVTIGVGSYVSLQDMNLSYCLASQAAENQERAGICLEFGDDTTSVRYGYSYRLENEIFQAVGREDREGALSRFSELFSYIVAHANGVNEFIYRQLYIFSIGLARFRIDKNMEEIDHMGLEYMGDALSMYKWCEQSIEKCIYDINNRVVTYSDNLIEDAINFIHENYNQQITLADISGRVYLSSYYFTKLFKMKTGKTFVEYLTNYRIEMAKKLLKEDANYRIQDICDMVGYSDKKYFCKCFKKNTGMTPAAYRGSMD